MSGFFFCRNGRRVWLRSRGFIKCERTKRHANEPLADENWLAQYEAERLKEKELDGLASVAISTGVEEQACSLLLLRCFATGSTRELLGGVYTNFRTFQSVFFPLRIKASAENYFRGIDLQLQSKWKKHVPDQTQMQDDRKLVITRKCIFSHLPLASLACFRLVCFL